MIGIIAFIHQSLVMVEFCSQNWSSMQAINHDNEGK